MDKSSEYEILGVVGQGQYGVAYKAEHRADRHLYCIKRIPMSAKDDQKSAMREAELLKSLNHPNIIAYKDTFVDREGNLNIVTQFCEEGDLFGQIRKRQQEGRYFTEEEVMDTFIQIASALRYIHDRRILHRDLKTQNIFLSRGGIPKLGDFGISKVLEKTDSFTNTVTGTPYYMAPEICKNEAYTLKSDIWSLGCVLYELCTLKHAFAADSLLSLVFQIVKGTYPPIPADRFSPELSTLISKLLVREADRRPKLSKVFEDPFVLEHLDRFERQQGARVATQKAATMARLRDGVPLRAANGRQQHQQQAEESQLTPKERQRLRKERDAEQRALELQVASMSMAQDRDQVVQRKQQMVYESNVPGLGVRKPMTPSYMDDSPNMGTVVGRGTRAATRGPGGYGGGGFEDSMVNMDTMPAGQGINTYARQQLQPQTQTRPASRGMQASASAYDAGGYGRGGPYSPQQQGTQRRAGGGYSAQQDEDEVLMASVMQNTALVRPGAGGYVDPYGATVRSPGAAATASRMEPGTRGYNNGAGPASPRMDSTVLMASVNLGPGGRMAGTAGVYDRMGATAGAHDRMGATTNAYDERPIKPGKGYTYNPDDYDEPSQQQPATYQPYQQPAAKQKSPLPSPGKKLPSPRRAGGVAEEESYEDDFEQYDDDEAEQDDDKQEIQERVDIIRNAKVLERGVNDSGNDLVSEAITTSTKNGKAAALRDRCRQALGPDFETVYRFLRQARSTNADEREVQRRLLELLRNDKSRMPGCFFVDQLVFMEGAFA